MNNKDILEKLDWYQINDPSNEEIYNLVVNLTGNLIKHKKFNMQPIDFDNITHDIAAKVYEYVYTKKYPEGITSWRAFILRMLKLCYVPRQREKFGSQVFDTNYDPVAKQNLVETFVTNPSAYKSINRAENRELFSHIGKIVEVILNESKFANDPTKRLPLEISIALSLRDNNLIYFHLTEDLKPYVNIFVSKVLDVITEACRTTGERDDDITWSSFYATELFQFNDEL